MSFFKKHGTVFTCSYPLPINFSCVYFINFPLCAPGNLLRMGIFRSSALLWIVQSLASRLRFLLEKMSTRRQHFFIPASCYYGNSSLGGYPSSVQFSQSLSRVRLLAPPWISARQASPFHHQLPGLVVNESRMRHRMTSKVFVSLAFEV